MSKIRINELARQLEIPSHDIFDMLAEISASPRRKRTPAPSTMPSRRRSAGECTATGSGRDPNSIAEPQSRSRSRLHAEEYALEPPPLRKPPHPLLLKEGRPRRRLQKCRLRTDDSAPTMLTEEPPPRSKPAPIRPPLAAGGSAPAASAVAHHAGPGAARSARSATRTDPFRTAAAIAARLTAAHANAGSARGAYWPAATPPSQ